MERIPVKRNVDLDVDALVKHEAPALPPMKVPTGPYSIFDAETGDTIAIVVKAPPDLARRAKQAYDDIPRNTVRRAAGIRTRSQVFGWSAPNNVMQRPTPTLSRWMREWPDSHDAFPDLATWCWAALAHEAPESVVGLMERTKAAIHPDYLLGNSPWTSGIANDTVQLHYHHDRNNVAHTWSAMLCTRAGTRGGNLHVADYDAVLPIRDRDVLMFPGVDWVHGVTPITRPNKGGFRYTFVMYAVNVFINKPGPVEARHLSAVRRTELEADLIERQREAGTLK